MVLSKKQAEQNAKFFRIKEIGLNSSEAIDVKTVLRKLNILTVYLPMSETAYGLSLSSQQGDKFILVNSNTRKGRQHFTIAHELFHLFYDDNPTPHLCTKDGRSATEKAADAFAAALLMPEDGVIEMIPDKYLRSKELPISVVLRLEQYFRVSRSAMLYRLKNINVISQDNLDKLLELAPKQTAKDYGYDTTLYEVGNDYLTIGDYGEKARLLFESEIISEGHYEELINKIRHDKEEDSAGC